MNGLLAIVSLVVFPGGLFLLMGLLAYEWVDRKLLALLQNRVGLCWFQPLANIVKLLTKEETIPDKANKVLFIGLPFVALAGDSIAALYVPMAGIKPAYGFPGDLIVTQLTRSAEKPTYTAQEANHASQS